MGAGQGDGGQYVPPYEGTWAVAGAAARTVNPAPANKRLSHRRHVYPDCMGPALRLPVHDSFARALGERARHRSDRRSGSEIAWGMVMIGAPAFGDAPALRGIAIAAAVRCRGTGW